MGGRAKTRALTEHEQALVEVISEAAQTSLARATSKLTVSLIDDGSEGGTAQAELVPRTLDCARVSVYLAPDALTVGIGPHGVQTEIFSKDLREQRRILGELIRVVVAGGYEEWVRPAGSEPHEPGFAGIAQIHDRGSVSTIRNNTFRRLSSIKRRPDWHHWEYRPYE